MTAGSLPGSRRTLLSVAIVVSVVLVQLLASFVGNRDSVRFFSVLLFLVIELPVVLVVLSALFSWTRRTGRGWIWFVGLGVISASLTGLASGAIFFAIAEALPSLDLHLTITQPPTLARSLVIGFIHAQSHLGLWTLAFVLPFTLEDSRVRAAEAQQLRSSTELARLRANLEPHFLLNTLNAIAGLVTED